MNAWSASVYRPSFLAGNGFMQIQELKDGFLSEGQEFESTELFTESSSGNIMGSGRDFVTYMLKVNESKSLKLLGDQSVTVIMDLVFLVFFIFLICLMVPTVISENFF